MNVAGISNIGSKAKPAAEAIARTCERYGLGVQFGHAGKHPYAEITWNRQSRKVYFSGTPTASGATHNVITDVKKAARSLGWEPTNDNQETDEMQIVKSLSDLPRLADRSIAPEIPANWRGKSIRGRASSADLQEALKKRNDWIMEQSAAGVRHFDILEDLRRAGWDIQSPGAIDMVVFKCKGGKYPSQNKAPLPKPANATKTDMGPEFVIQYQSPEGTDPLVVAIAQAIAPLIRDQLAQQAKSMEILKAKADKWDAISGLVREA